jgi:3-phosphoshikimate 1-carboxyvinyltransferase
VLHERPYVDMTIDWLASQGVEVERDGYAWFRVRGGHRYAAFQRRVPGDFSTATFFLAAGALPGNAVTCRGLDMNDTQGDRAVADYLREMGAQVEVTAAGIRVTGATLRGCELDLNATPDALPMMAALACYARGETRLVNVPQARVKETDRIAVMREELEKMGGDVEELEDGLVIRERPLRGVTVDGRDDHRVVMALAIAATAAEGSTRIRGAEAMAVTNPGFVEALESIGGLARAEEPATKEGAA